MFLLSCLVLDIGVVDHVNIFVLTCVHFGVVGVVLSSPLSHSGLLICDMHFGITHLVPHHCTPALLVFVGKPHHNSSGEVAFSLAWLSLWTISLFKQTLSVTDASVMGEKRVLCSLRTDQTDTLNQRQWKTSASHRFTLLNISTASHQY